MNEYYKIIRKLCNKGQVAYATQVTVSEPVLNYTAELKGNI